MSDLQKRYAKLHSEYIRVGGPLFDSQDIDQAAISYAYNTCGLEGNTITLGETETIIITDKVIPGRTLREHLEIKDSHHAFVQIFAFCKENFQMNEKLAMTLHRLNTSNWLDEQWSGTYKTINNRVGGKATPYPAKAAELFKNLFSQLDAEKDPFAKASKLHLETVLIHPWQDGNGRTARLMMNYILIQNGHGHIQIPKTEKDVYFQAIRESIDIQDQRPFRDYLYSIANTTYEKKIDFLSGKKKGRTEGSPWAFNEPIEIYG